MRRIRTIISFFCAVVMMAFLLAGCNSANEAEPTGAASQAPAPSVSVENGDWRASGDYSADYVFSDDLTLCFSPLEAGGGVDVFNSESGEHMGTLEFPQEYEFVPLAEGDPYRIKTLTSDEEPPLIWVGLSNGSYMLYAYEPDESEPEKEPFLFFVENDNHLAIVESSLKEPVRAKSDVPYEIYAIYELDDTQRDIYLEIISKIFSYEYFEYQADTYGQGTLDNLLMAWSAVRSDYPTIDNYFTISNITQNGVTTGMYSEYLCLWEADRNGDPAAVQAGQEAFEAEVDEIIEGMPQDASTFMKYFYLAQELCARAEYDYENEQAGNATPYSALISGKTICQGYARAYQALCQEAGLSCREVTGSSEGVAHAWNIVELERDTYYVDLTWADERGEPGTPEWLQYFMLTQDEILFDHQIDDGSVATGGQLGLI